MPRKLTERTPFYPYHVNNRSIDKAFYPINMDEAWKLSCDLLCILSWMYDAKIHAFVLMSNHYHMLLSTPSENIDDCIQYFQSNFSLWMAKKTGLGAYSFDKRYGWSIVKDPVYYASVYRYTYQNPLRAGMVNLTEDYEYSTLRGSYGLSKLNCPIAPHDYDAGFSSIEESELTWLNTKIPSAESSKIRLGLRRRIYCPPTRLRKKVRKISSLEKAGGCVAKGVEDGHPSFAFVR